MWLTLPFAFLSVVQKRGDDPAVLTVRARSRADLERLCDRLEPSPKIQHTPERDYPYRLTCTRAELAAVLEAFITDELTYDNFKSEVARRDPGRAELLHEVWDVMRGAEDPEARRGR